MPDSEIKSSETSYIIFNAFGAGNLGDDLLLKAAVEQYGLDKIRMAVGFGEPQLRDIIPYITYDDYLGSGYLSPELKDCTFVIYGGGLMWSAENLATLCILEADRATNTALGEKLPFDIVGIGLQGPGFFKPVVRRLATLARRFSVRDSFSAASLKPVRREIEVIDDPVYTMLKQKNLPRTHTLFAGNQITVGLSLGEAWFNDSPAKANHLIETLGYLNHLMIQANTGLPALKFVFIPHVEHRLSERESDTLVGAALAQSKIASLFDVAPFPKYAEDLPELYRSCDLVLSNRFHGLVIPQAFGIPSWGLTWKKGGEPDKVGAFCLDRKLPLFCLERAYESVGRALAAEIHALYDKPYATEGSGPSGSESTFYDFDLEDRQKLARDSFDQKRTLTSRWETLEPQESDDWKQRAEYAGRMIGKLPSVVDLGCGLMTLERYLDKETVYLPVDVAARDVRTVVLDLNKDPLPDLKTEGLAALGVIEYIYDVPKLLSRICAYYKTVVVTYNATDNYPSREARIGHAWVNHFSIKELEFLLADAGFLIEERAPLGPVESIWKLTSTKCR